MSELGKESIWMVRNGNGQWRPRLGSDNLIHQGFSEKYSSCARAELGTIRYSLKGWGRASLGDGREGKGKEGKAKAKGRSWVSARNGKLSHQRRGRNSPACH